MKLAEIFFKILILLYSLYVPIAISLESSFDYYYQVQNINNQKIQILTVNPIKYKIINISAKAIHKNIATVRQIANKFNALAAVNGGFFREINNNRFVPAGLLKINNVWQGIAYKSRAAIGWKTSSNQVSIDRITTKTFLQIKEQEFPVNHFNPSYIGTNQSTNKLSIYSNIHPDFNNIRSSDEQNFFSIIEKEQVNYIYSFNSKLKSMNFSLSELNTAKLLVHITPQIEPHASNLWENFDYITSGSPVLVKKHKVLYDYYKETISNNFINSLNPRTAICIMDNGFWKFIKAPNSTIPELAEIMVTIGCKEAINLDGGNSSDLYLSERIANEPEFTSILSPVTDAILILPN